MTNSIPMTIKSRAIPKPTITHTSSWESPLEKDPTSLVPAVVSMVVTAESSVVGPRIVVPILVKTIGGGFEVGSVVSGEKKRLANVLELA